ncbi:hypothetical protein VTJ49DRAFT_738 [Mycothermus thermophilus]|uniref:F-box domain-containing protein n=1 Tax=Humicola insolens TaxID=85995 RepID=A0ABR3VE96_HUMIN
MLIHDLPTELLDAIVAVICRDRDTDPSVPSCVRWFSYFCDCPWPPTDGQDLSPCQRNRQREITLKSLCLTSRALHTVALPHLYHHLWPRDWQVLARTLAARPDLARHARSLIFGAWQDLAQRHPEPWKYISRLNLAAETPLVSCFEFRRYEYLARCRPWNLYIRPWDVERRRVTFASCVAGNDTLALDLLVSMLPNLHTLIAGLNLFYAFRFCRPGSLPRLRYIHLYPDDQCRMLMSWHMPGLMRVFAAAQDSLESVVLEVCDKFQLEPQSPEPSEDGSDEEEVEEVANDGGELEEQGDDDEDSEEEDEGNEQADEADQVVEQPTAEQQAAEQQAPDQQQTEDQPAEQQQAAEEQEEEEEEGFRIICPRVTHLTILDRSFDLEFLRHIFVSFPNVTHFYFQLYGPGTMRPGFGEDLEDDNHEPLDQTVSFFRSRSPMRAPKLQSFVLEIKDTYTNWRRWLVEDHVAALLAEMEERGVKFELRPPSTSRAGAAVAGNGGHQED